MRAAAVATILLLRRLPIVRMLRRGLAPVGAGRDALLLGWPDRILGVLYGSEAFHETGDEVLWR